MYNFIHDENEEDLIFIRMLLARRPWEASSNQVTNTWQALTDAIRMQQDSKGNFPFQNIATKTLRSRYNAYLGLEQYWTEKVDPAENENDDGKPPSPAQEIRDGIDDLFEMVRNFTDARAAEKDGMKMKDLIEKGQVQEMKARALLNLDKALDGVVVASKSNMASGSSLPSSLNSSASRNGGVIEIVGKDDDVTSNGDGMSRTNSPDGSNPKSTPPGRTKKQANRGIHGLSELERMQQNFQAFKETKAANRIELQKEREKRKRQEAETAQLEQENTRLRLELENAQIQANISLQQQMMEQQMQMQQQMMALISRLTNNNSGSNDMMEKTNDDK